MKISEFQKLMKDLYFHKDDRRGIDKTFIWLMEEMGELATILKEKDINKVHASEELADLIAWICSLSNLLEIDLESALRKKYPKKCLKCNSIPCECKF